MGFLDRLAARTAATGTVLCVGLDPDPFALPAGFPPDVQGIEAFSRLILEASLPFAAAVKANLAFFEAFGPDGIAALERLRAEVPADVPFLADAKRGDIGTTAARQAVALFDRLGADAVTASPYLGSAAIEPLLERTDRFVYVLCRTSNPGADELQHLTVVGDGRAPSPSRSTNVSPASSAAGVPAGPSASSSGRPRRPSSPGPGRSRPDSPSSCPASEPRVARSDPSSNTVRRRPLRPVSVRAAGCW